MNIYQNLEAITQVALQYAKEHDCNYNIILMNPDENDEFSEANGSTYEMVADSYFDKERSNVKLITTTDEIILQEQLNKSSNDESKLDDDVSRLIGLFDNSNPYINTYRDMIDDGIINQIRIPHNPYVREERKIGRNETCPCDSGLKYKKCCGK